MDALSVHQIPYQNDSTALFECIRDLPLPVFLDSARPYTERGRYDLIAAAPIAVISNKNLYKTKSNQSKLNLFEETDRALQQLLPAPQNPTALPFCGGAIGYFGYDLCRQQHKLAARAPGDISTEDGCVGIYSWALLVDHQCRRSALLFHPATPQSLQRDIHARFAGRQRLRTGAFALQGDFTSNFTAASYREAFEQVQRYIRAGDCYQVNLAQRFQADYQGDPWGAYLALRRVAAAPFSAYLEPAADTALLSMSPERFVQLRGDTLRTEPIKGTRPRSADAQRDRALAQALCESAKDRAENLMIVDLLRNDLGTSCRPGSIAVDKLFELQSFDTVHHLVSTISGEKQAGLSALQVLRNCFPGGSITGAPKLRAMQIIDQLEPHRRSLYCGNIAYISCDGTMDSNIAIRSMLCEQQRIYCWSGGGIVADSRCEEEYQESLNKVNRLLQALRTA